MPVYLTADEIIAINLQFLGSPALRDEPALLAALARPLAVAYYQQADLASQAAVLIEGIAQAHSLIDGNKRTATAAGIIFLRLNGWVLRYAPHPSLDPLGQQVVDLVTHLITADALAQWIRAHLVALP